MTLATHVKKVAKGADTKALASALGALVKARLAKPKPARLQSAPEPRYGVVPVLGRAKPVRRSTRRRGRNQAYVPTSKPDISRLGTFRHYMLQTIRKHKSTWDAEAEHALCDNPKFAKNRLDFSWAASEGYIDFI